VSVLGAIATSAETEPVPLLKLPADFPPAHLEKKKQ